MILTFARYLIKCLAAIFIFSHYAYAAEIKDHWAVSERYHACIAERYFNDMKVKIEARPLERSSLIHISKRGVFQGLVGGEAEVLVNGHQIPPDITFTNSSFPERNISWLVVKIPNYRISLKSLKLLQVKTTNNLSYQIDVQDIGNLDATFIACEQHVLSDMNIPISELTDIAQPAVALPGEPWVNIKGTTPNATHADLTVTVVLWTIGADGRISDCHVAFSSGSPILDATICPQVLALGRYKPALDFSGKPIAMHKMLKVGWGKSS